MTSANHATPLMALDAVVLDTETTGLDPARARVVEIGAVRIHNGRVDEGATLRLLVRPDEPVPAAATAIHGIDEVTLADAPDFAAAWPQLQEFIGGRVVIGHTVGFDLAVLKRECERAGIEFRRPRTLDTRLLAQVASPALASYSLESLSSWLGVEGTGRHSALGDAVTTARIFRALVPKLREGGIRTLAEAMASCRALTDVLDEQHRAGWIEAVAAPARRDAERALGRIDSYPYRHRVRDVMSAPAKFIAQGRPVGEALSRMMEERVSSLYVRGTDADENGIMAADAGIVTERDILRALAQRGADALSAPVESIMCRPLAAVPVDAFVYRAIGRMARLHFRHLGVVDDLGRIVGALSARNLLRLRAGEAVSLGDEIDEATDVHQLGVAWAKLPQVAASLLDEEVPARDIAAVISRELGALTRRAAVLAEARLAEEGHGAPPCAYAFVVLGSAGRGESLLAMDQDNAIVFAEGAPQGREDAWFARLGIHVADILHEVGVPYCVGGIMAKNPLWRGSVATWNARIADWIQRSSPQDLLAVDIFFDLRGVHGDGHLADVVWRAAFEAARGQSTFAKLLAEASGSVESGIGLFGGIKTSAGRIDLKKAGLFGVVSTARVLAVCHHVVERATPARLAGLKALGIGGAKDLDALSDAQAVFLDLILRQQVEDIAAGRAPSNKVQVSRLAAREREALQNALQAVQHLDALTRDMLFRG
ncbi:MAG: CBS domain-containing protein [Pseudorhodoplanes sp.]|nr:DNA polymerase III PolC-type [Pseudorhodoplanes sp.]MBW7949317.1 CBS domain-containing protein [Pseudorhodoplanes sp.]